jgi:hypothetical protein
MLPIVIARAHAGEPLKRVAVAKGNGVVYIANPARITEIIVGNGEPTGFPCEDIFAFESATYDILREQWRNEGKTHRQAWHSLSLFDPDSIPELPSKPLEVSDCVLGEPQGGILPALRR